ncbi:MAG: hypothetical protein CSA62_12465 [Planctomycetota bacterium]|nr:MAG: hypothetical protein CSA62_12465 [Planctomycetota bacterium]
MLSSDELQEAFADPLLAPAQNLYLRNQMAVELRRLAGDDEAPYTGDYLGVFVENGLRALALFSRLGVLVVGGGCADDAAELARFALGAVGSFRLVIAERELGVALLARLASRSTVTMNRSQPFLVYDAPARTPSLDARVRPACQKDAAWLSLANLELNEEDLDIQSATVHRGLLRRRVEDRIAAGQSWVLDFAGKPVSKLELGSCGPAGILVEGVFTDRGFRGRGFAQSLLMQVCAYGIPAHQCIGLHCSRSNGPALSAYKAAGFREVADLRLACLRW